MQKNDWYIKTFEKYLYNLPKFYKGIKILSFGGDNFDYNIKIQIILKKNIIKKIVFRIVGDIYYIAIIAYLYFNINNISIANLLKKKNFIKNKFFDKEKLWLFDFGLNLIIECLNNY